MDMLNLYKCLSENISQAVALSGTYVHTHTHTMLLFISTVFLSSLPLPSPPLLPLPIPPLLSLSSPPLLPLPSLQEIW